MIRVICIALLFFAFTVQAQLELKKLDGTPINNNDVFTFTSLTEPGAYLGLKIYNTSDEDISIKARVVSIVNSTGTNVQLCVGGVCLSAITAGSTYPNFPAVIPANGENGNFDHFINYNAGINQTQPVEYTIKILMVNDLGQEVGNSVQFTYRYTSTLSSSDFSLNNLGIKVGSVLLTDTLNFESADQGTVDLFDLTGKLMFSNQFSGGNNQANLPLLPVGLYIANFTLNNGQSARIKVIKK